MFKLLLFLPFYIMSFAWQAQALVMGIDGRKEVFFENTPFEKVVNVLRPDGSACTGALVGKDLVLTAAHCIKINNVPNPTAIRVRTTYKDGVSDMQSPVLDATYPDEYFKDDERKYDWAILKLGAPLGEIYGFFSVYPTMKLHELQNLTLPGYNTDLFKGEVLTADQNCKVTSITTSGVVIKTFDNFFFHDCDSAEGSSGAPILNCHLKGKTECVLVGLNRGHSNYYFLGNRQHHLYATHDNDAVHPKAFFAALSDLLR